LWYNGVPALQFSQSVLRTSASINSITGLFFSTFFGGDDTSWASPTQQYTYYKNIQMFAGSGASNSSGPATTSSKAGAADWMGSGGLLLLLGASVVGAVGVLRAI
jgi:hypothetical protein